MIPILLPRLADAGAIRPGPFFPPLMPVKTPDAAPFVSMLPAKPLRPILFTLAFAGLGSKQIGNPVPWLAGSRSPLPAYQLYISGVTKDSSGAALGNCAVALYRTVDDVMVQRTTSDASGNYSFAGVGAQAYYVVAYKAGSPDVAGTTVNTVMGQ